ncbi:Toll/interleukin-1 receptor domain-containing protein [Paraburkholderia kururiensis]|uniref:toll/interleukin-1 receptor domain-containing protein n=1 Tax=Paraburkholderia kururiensis TaxID=984307 RepID=UPI0039A62503
MDGTVPAVRNALFISHATPEDNEFARWLGAKLTAMGYEVWADVMRLHGGIDWARELEQALRQRAVKMLLVCTPSGLEKQGVRNEIEIATGLARQLGDASFILPLRLEPYDAPFRIAHAQYIDFRKSWASGLAELTELLRNQAVPSGAPGSMDAWLRSHAFGSARLLVKREPLMSNWLTIQRNPEQVFYCEPPVGSSLERFQHRQCHLWPVVPHRAGVITFATPDAAGLIGTDLPAKQIGAIPTDAFLEQGWADYGIDAYQARNMYSDLGAQAFENYCRRRGLKAHAGAGNRASWWGDVKTVPLGQVKFDWGFRRGARQIIGQSEKRKVHWHYAVNAQLRTSPFPHVRLAARLIFSENGLDAIADPRRAHSLRRSLAKAWRNARWRDMLCAYLWWLSDTKSDLSLPVADGVAIAASIPPMQISCPVSVDETGEEVADEDDPDVMLDEWDDEVEETEE